MATYLVNARQESDTLNAFVCDEYLGVPLLENAVNVVCGPGNRSHVERHVRAGMLEIICPDGYLPSRLAFHTLGKVPTNNYVFCLK